MGNKLSIKLREKINRVVKDLIEEEVSRLQDAANTAAYASTAAYNKFFLQGVCDGLTMERLLKFLQANPVMNETHNLDTKEHV